MKKFLSIVTLIFTCLISGFSQLQVDTLFVNESGLQYVLIEHDTVSQAAIAAGVPENAVSYRIFADMEPGYKFIDCGGKDKAPIIPLEISSTEPFYNETTFGNGTGAASNPVLFALYPELAYDSYITDGRIGSGHVGVLKSVDPSGRVPITPETTPIQAVVLPQSGLLPLITDGSSQVCNDKFGYWGVAGGIGGPDAESNILFVAQFVTAGELKMLLNFGLKDPDVGLIYARSIKYPSEKAPIIKMVEPENGEMFNSGSDITISVSALDVDGNVDSVVFYSNNVKLGTDNEATNDTLYSFNWAAVSSGEYWIKAVATDNGALSTTSDSVKVTVNTAPSVVIIAPLDGTEYVEGEIVTFKAVATDEDGTVDSVAFLKDGEIINGYSTSETDTFIFEWTSIRGADDFNFIAIAVDNMGLSDTSAVLSINVTGTNSPPVIEFLSEADSIIIKRNIVLTVKAYDEIMVDSVQFFVDDIFIGTDVLPTQDSLFSVIWTNAEIDTVEIKAVGFDNDQEATTAVKTARIVPNMPPTIELTEPVDNARLKFRGGDDPEDFDRITIITEDFDGDVDSVEVFINGIKSGKAAYNQLTRLWNYTKWKIIEDTVTIRVTAHDDFGNTASDSITVFKDQPPQITLLYPRDYYIFTTGDSINLRAEPTDDVGIQYVQFYLNGTALGDQITSQPYSHKWVSEVEDTVTIYAMTIDNASQSAISDEVTIYINKPNAAPEISIENPNEGDTVAINTEIVIAATAIDDNQVDSVLFLINDNKVFTDIEEPYEFTWTPVSQGNHVILVIAFDNKGKSSFVKYNVYARIETVINEINPEHITFYPNPATDKIFIKVGNDKLLNTKGSLTLYSIQGVPIRNYELALLNNNVVEVNLTNLKTGSYVFVANIDGEIHTVLILKE